MTDHVIQIAGTEVHFACTENETVLDAALRAGIEMPYSCRKGVCGNCAGAVAHGQLDCPPSAVAEPGMALLCQCRPRSDLVIVPQAWHRVDPAARKTFAVKVYRNTRAANDVSILQLRLPAGQRAKFKAGQYLQVCLPDGSRRSYSMANPPHESDMLQLHVRHVTGGQFTEIVAGLQPGDGLRVELPFGSFELDEAASAPLLCVAGGTGFAPIKSLLDDLVRKRSSRQVTLVWGARDAAGLYMPSAIERWTTSLPGFVFVAAVETAPGATPTGVVHGRADDAVRLSFESLHHHDVYCCGAPPMVAAVKRVCVDGRRLDPTRFFSDAFVAGPAASV